MGKKKNAQDNTNVGDPNRGADILPQLGALSTSTEWPAPSARIGRHSLSASKNDRHRENPILLVNDIISTCLLIFNSL